jgi:hypothetical protein
MLDILIPSKTRFNLLIKFFLVQGTKSYLRMLEKEFNESTNALRVELNRMEEARLLISENNMNRKYFMANPKHPLYEDIKNLVHKELGIEQIIDRITCCVGDLESAYIIGNFAQGINSDTIELALIGKNLDTDYINQLIPKAEKMINRKIKYMTLLPDQMDYFFKDKPKYLFWQAGGEDKS